MLRDCLSTSLRLVICGTAAGTVSAARGQYYAGPGNKFWRTLHDVGLTPRRLDPSEYRLLLGHGIGLTDIVKRQAGMDREIDFRRSGREELRGKILRCRPRILCFNGKRAAQEYLRRRRIDFGRQEEGIGNTRLFVAPSTSGAANAYWDIRYWHRLGELASEPLGPSSGR